MSELTELYQQVILDHNKSPRNFGKLDDPDVHVEANNPLCGDRLAMDLVLRDGLVEDVRFSGRGCAISQASASMLTEQLTGKSREAAEEKIEAFLEMMRTEEKEELGELAALKGVVQTPNRIRCATLAWDAMRRALPTL